MTSEEFSMDGVSIMDIIFGAAGSFILLGAPVLGILFGSWHAEGSWVW